MKITLRLIVYFISIVCVMAFIFSYRQAIQEETRLKNELEKRADVVADSLRFAVEPSLSSNNLTYLQNIVDRFSNRERLAGVDIHDSQEKLIVASGVLKNKLDTYPDILNDSIEDVKATDSKEGRFIVVDNKLYYVYSEPLKTDGKINGVLSLFYEGSYITERIKRVGINGFLQSLVPVFLISLVTFIIFYLNVMTPIKTTTEWIKKIRKGEHAQRLDARHELLLGPLAAEITQMAKSLEKARLAAEEEARLRYSSESRWTQERLKEVVRLRLEDRPLFVVSNREPYMHIRNGKEIKCIVPASGLVTAIEPVLNACGGTWIAHGSGNADRETVDQYDKIQVPPQEPKYTLRRIWLEKELEDGFYTGFSNEGLWPLCLIAHTRPVFRYRDWLAYEIANKRFAEAVLEEIENTTNPYVLIQDYHFALLPGMIKARRPDARVAIFWHIPWPNPESFGICPWQKELLKGMLGADLVGFHIQFHCNNFIETVDRFLETRIDYEHFTINREGHTTWVKPFPVSINCDDPAYSKHPFMGSKEILMKKHGIQPTPWMALGVDRLDYTKGILERLRSVEAFLDKYHEYRGHFTFIELGAPTRSMIPKYQEFIDEIIRETQRINDKFKTKNWQPVILLMKHHSHEEILPFYQAADMCLVTSLHDGMNLVAKEFVSAREDEEGVLILSQFTGASRELRDALIVNPYDVYGTAEAIKLAFSMSKSEKIERMKRMRKIIKDNNIYRWAGELVGQLTQIPIEDGRVFVL